MRVREEAAKRGFLTDLQWTSTARITLCAGAIRRGQLFRPVGFSRGKGAFRQETLP